MTSKRTSSFSLLRYFLHLAFVLGGIVCIGYSISVDASLKDVPSTLWIVDTSLSMGIEDMGGREKDRVESRFTLAKSAMREGISRISGRHAIIAYGENAGIASPLSSDIAHLSQVVGGLRIVENYGGSNLSSALSLAKSVYLSSGISPHIIILTDGGLTTGSVLPDIQGFQITLVALGSDAGGKIPLGYNAQGERRYKYYEGKEVVVPFDQSNIDSIEKKYNATIFRVRDVKDLLEFLSEKSMITFSYSFWRIFGIVLTLIGFLIHPYVRRKS